jgi:hypothetical protein
MAVIKVDYGSAFGLNIDKKWINYSKGYKPDFPIIKGYSYDITYDDKGLISSVTKIKPSVKDGLESNKKPVGGDSRQRDIVRSQCLKMAFDFWNNKIDFDISNPKHREQMFNDAKETFRHLEESGFLGW